MDFLVVALVARLLGTAFLAGLFGGGIWLLGTMLAASHSVGNEAAVVPCTILGVGISAGVVAWAVEVRQEEIDLRGGLARLAVYVALAVAMTSAGLFLLGGVLLDGQGEYNPYGAHGTPEVVGAWLGSVLGATLAPGVRGVRRVAHRREPLGADTGRRDPASGVRQRGRALPASLSLPALCARDILEVSKRSLAYRTCRCVSDRGSALQ